MHSPRWLKLAGWIILLFSVDSAILSLAYMSLPPTRHLLKEDPFERPDLVGQHRWTITPGSEDFVELPQIPAALISAVILLEDDQFFKHRGFDFAQMRKAWRESKESGRRLRGASTLSQQLSKNLFLTADRSWKRKLREALITIKLELHLPKERILELYLNSIDWGQNQIGIRRATQHYFGKDPQDLSLRESVYLASIIPNPARLGRQPPPESVTRRSLIALERLYRQRVISFEAYHQAAKEELQFRRPRSRQRPE